MAYNKNIPAGTYLARALQADCFPTKNGEGLMLGVEWVVAQGEQEGSQLSGNICLIDGQGQLTRNYADVREWAKTWDGIDTSYFKGHFSEWDVEIVVVRKMIDTQDENGNPIQREIPEVKYVNDPNGRHSKAVQAGDHKALGAKFGAKLRAAAASTAKPGAPVQQKPQTPPPATPPASDGSLGMSAQQIMSEAWEAFKMKNAELTDDQRREKWMALVGNHVAPGDDPRKAPASTWEKILADVNDDMPF